MRRLLSGSALLLVGCASAAPTIVVGFEPAPMAAAVTSAALVRVSPADRALVRLNVELAGQGPVKVISEDATTVRVCWGDPARADSERAYLRIELLEGEARFQEHRVDFSADEAGRVTVADERMLVGLKQLDGDPISPDHHVHVTLLPDGRYDAALKTTPSLVSSFRAPTDVVHLAGGPIWTQWPTRGE